MSYNCPCGNQHEYVSEEKERLVESLIEKVGEDIVVTVLLDSGEEQKFKIPRRYIVFHGLKAREVESLGFPRVK